MVLHLHIQFRKYQARKIRSGAKSLVVEEQVSVLVLCRISHSEISQKKRAPQRSFSGDPGVVAGGVPTPSSNESSSDLPAHSWNTQTKT